VEGFVEDLRARNVTPHIAIDGRVSKLDVVRKTSVDGRTTRHPGYAASLRVRKRIEEIFGWAKTTGGIAISARAADHPQPLHRRAPRKSISLHFLGVFQQPAKAIMSSPKPPGVKICINLRRAELPQEL
jgi:hypothetical protein